jgi:GNAT superfamily N-acetyltransferase
MLPDTTKLKDGRTLSIEGHPYPLEAAMRTRLIDLLQQVFPRTDVDWLQSMRGVYAEDLRTVSVLGSVDGDAVAHAAVAFCQHAPEVCVIEDVATLPSHRGLGIARTLSERAVHIGFGAGCRVAYLGNAPTARCVYEEIGFERISGVFMRRPAPGGESYEDTAFAPAQSVTVRETNWGDLPAVACLMAQPMTTLLAHYSQGLASTAYAPAARGVSNFTSVKYECEARGGVMVSLVSDAAPHRVLGFAAAVPGPGALRQRTAQLDAVTHDNYAARGNDLVAALLRWCGEHHIERVHALVADQDTTKQRWFEHAGLAQVGTIPDALHLEETWHAVTVLQRTL